MLTDPVGQRSNLRGWEATWLADSGTGNFTTCDDMREGVPAAGHDVGSIVYDSFRISEGGSVGRMGKLPWVEDEAKCKQVGVISNHTYHKSLLSHR